MIRNRPGLFTAFGSVKINCLPVTFITQCYFCFVFVEGVVVRVSDEGFCPSRLVLYEGQVKKQLMFDRFHLGFKLTAVFYSLSEVNLYLFVMFLYI